MPGVRIGVSSAPIEAQEGVCLAVCLVLARWRSVNLLLSCPVRTGKCSACLAADYPF